VATNVWNLCYLYICRCLLLGMVLTTVSSGSSLNVTWAINSANIAATQGILTMVLYENVCVCVDTYVYVHLYVYVHIYLYI
jgi:hypothetical protein